MSVTTEKSAIRPFAAETSQAELQALRQRVADTRWPDRETVPDHSQGVQLDTIRELARYWAADYDRARCQAKLNALPQFKTEIDGLDIHFIHVRSEHDDALPIILTHGWPGSVIELLKVIDPLTNPTAHGGTASDAFHVVIPSMPGYGYSDKPGAPGWGPDRIASCLGRADEAPRIRPVRCAGRRLGSGCHGSDGRQAPPELLGMHTNMPGVIPPEIAQALPIPGQLAPGDPPPAGLAADEQRAFEQISTFYTTGRRLCGRDGDAAADAVRSGGFAGRPGGVDDQPRRLQLRRDRAGLRGQAPSANSPATRSWTTSRSTG